MSVRRGRAGGVLCAASIYSHRSNCNRRRNRRHRDRRSLLLIACSRALLLVGYLVRECMDNIRHRGAVYVSRCSMTLCFVRSFYGRLKTRTYSGSHISRLCLSAGIHPPPSLHPYPPFFPPFYLPPSFPPSSSSFPPCPSSSFPPFTCCSASGFNSSSSHKTSGMLLPPNISSRVVVCLDFFQLGCSQARAAVEPQHIHRPNFTSEVKQTDPRIGRRKDSNSGRGSIRRDHYFLLKRSKAARHGAIPESLNSRNDRAPRI